MTIGVYTSSAALQEAASALAQQLELPPADTDAASMLLELTPEDYAPGFRLSLRLTAADAPGPVACDFTSGRNAHRRQHGGGRGQAIARAIGIQKDHIPHVLDTTAGLGRDAYVLATLGCEVTMLERSPILAALLENGLQRALDQYPDDPVFARIQLLHADAFDYLDMLHKPNRYDVIYLDPMYPHRDKHVLVKKEMQVLQHLLGSHDDAARILAAALSKAGRRVVVKRPVWAPPLDGPPPRHQIKGKTTRFDIYPTC